MFVMEALNMNQYLCKILVKRSMAMRKKLFFLITLTMVICLGTMVLGAQRQKEVKIYYKCVAIQSGDTLWGIAQKYKTEDQKIEHMIQEIMVLNEMRSENIRSGESLIVPLKKEKM